MSKLRTCLLFSYRTIVITQKRIYCDYRGKRTNKVAKTFFNIVYNGSIFLENCTGFQQCVTGGLTGCMSGSILSRCLGTFGSITVYWLIYLLVIGARRHIIAKEWEKKNYNIGQYSCSVYARWSVIGFLFALYMRDLF